MEIEEDFNPKDINRRKNSQVIFPLTYVLCIIMNALSATVLPTKLRDITSQYPVAI